ncbi:MAG: hypothetical protein CMN76_09470 [Spirochaetaceae bacterium]|nr:hypothetical protein [Spirochaetaceae bacterium]|tara:strand:+ start:61123 stop:61386 length:264 start_codon:yes stop_codon:yes gene_type:complete
MGRIAVIVLLSIFAFSAGQCKKDPDATQEALIEYLVLCPNGIDACYDACSTTTGYPGDGSDFRAFQTCTAECDARCSTSALFLSISN